jgi:hypothetical protein
VALMVPAAVPRSVYVVRISKAAEDKARSAVTGIRPA